MITSGLPSKFTPWIRAHASSSAIDPSMQDYVFVDPKELPPPAHEDPYEDPWETSPLNIFSLKIKFLTILRNWIDALKTDDKEALRNLSLRLAEHPFLAAHTITSIINILLNITLILKKTYTLIQHVSHVLNTLIPYLAIPLCVLETLLGITSMRRIMHFAAPLISYAISMDFSEKMITKKWSKIVSLIPQQQQERATELKNQGEFEELKGLLLQADIELLRQRYFSTLYSEDQGAADLKSKFATLSRRVQRWMAEEMHDQLQTLSPLFHQLTQIEDRNQAVSRATELLENLTIQIRKKQVCYALGIVAGLIAIASCIAALVGCPPTVAAVLLVAGLFFSISRSCYKDGYWEQRGWDFNAKACIPSFLKYLYARVISKRKEPPPALSKMKFTWHSVRGAMIQEIIYTT